MIREDWPAALRELAELPDKIGEAVALLKGRQLYSQALRIFKGKEHFKVYIPYTRHLSLIFR